MQYFDLRYRPRLWDAFFSEGSILRTVFSPFWHFLTNPTRWLTQTRGRFVELDRAPPRAPPRSPERAAAQGPKGRTPGSSRGSASPRATSCSRCCIHKMKKRNVFQKVQRVRRSPSLRISPVIVGQDSRVGKNIGRHRNTVRTRMQIFIVL